MCRDLGYSGAMEFTVESKFGRVDSDFSYDDVSCSGNEKTLDDCGHEDEDNCSEEEGAGVICKI